MSVYNICKTLVEIDTELGFSQKVVQCKRRYDSGVDYISIGAGLDDYGEIQVADDYGNIQVADEFGNIQVEYQSIYFPDIIYHGFIEYSCAGKEINDFLRKYAGLKKAYQQELIDDNILQDAVNSLLKKLPHEKIAFKTLDGEELPFE